MITARAVTFFTQKDGNPVAEYEDAAASSERGPGAGGNPRFVVVDGATEAFDAIRWVRQLVTGFIADGAAPKLTAPSMAEWFEAMQRQWVDEAPPQTDVFEEIRFREGSFATLVGLELAGLDGLSPCWHAVALGDSVLFQVRGAEYVTHFPPLAIEDFGLDPAGVHTRPEALEKMTAGLRFETGSLCSGDVLYLATDAMAHWMLRRVGAHDRWLWPTLAGLLHVDTFRALVADRRAAGDLRNDDTTLLRIEIVADPPRFLAVCG